jgi:segregation and condensation protein A
MAEEAGSTAKVSEETALAEAGGESEAAGGAAEEGAAAQPAESVSGTAPDGSVHRLHEIRQMEGGQMTLALVQGETVNELPKDLYIPPHALEVFLETFEGPLDLLLYLIRRENLDILEIRVAEITEQYMSYIDLMSALQLELAGEYLVMAAMLAEIKSRMLLPRPVEADADEDDPRAELIRRLQEYEQIKTAAENIDDLPRLERDLFLARAARPKLISEHADPEVDLKEVLMALAKVLKRAEMFQRHEVHLEPLSVRERMTSVLAKVNESADFVPFSQLFGPEEGRLGVVVSFLAIMELLKESLIDFVQNEAFGPIYVRAAGDSTNRWSEE